jgi:hypothetical protein
MSDVIEVNYCSEDETFFTKSPCVPREGERIQIVGVDYIVRRVEWTLDYAKDSAITTKLRATVEITPESGDE